MFGFFDWIIDFFTSIFDFITSIIGLVYDFISNLFNFLAMIPDAVNSVTIAISCLPPFVMVFATASITVGIIYLLLGRGRTD